MENTAKNSFFPIGVRLSVCNGLKTIFEGGWEARKERERRGVESISASSA